MKKLLFLTLIISSGIFAQTSKETIQKINKYINYIEENNQLLGAVSIFENDKEIYSRTIGKKYFYTENETEKVYQIGSITKMFTAVLLAQLQEKGELSFDEPLSNYFPDMPNAKNIKLQNMLNHTSGLGDYVLKEDATVFWLKKPQTQQDILAEIKQQGTSFEVGTAMRYSNSAYYLLARILEIKYGKPYSKILNEQIIKPLGLQQTQAVTDKNNNSLKNKAKSYGKYTDTWEEIEEFYFPNASGVGNMLSTPYELNIFLTALFKGQLIKKETLEQLLPKDKAVFGQGFMKAPFYEYIAYGHGGDTYGTHAVTTYNRDENIAITYIVNGELMPTNDFAIGLLSMLYDKPYEYPVFTTFKVNESILNKYVGTYTSAEIPIDITIFKKGNILKAQGTGQPDFPLTAIAENTFEYKKAHLKIVFYPEKNQLLMEQNGMKFIMNKK